MAFHASLGILRHELLNFHINFVLKRRFYKYEIKLYRIKWQNQKNKHIKRVDIFLTRYRHFLMSQLVV